MKRIAILKVRTEHDLEWNVPPAFARLVDAAGVGGILARLRRTEGMPFMPQLTLPYLAALAEAHDRQAGTRHEYVLIDGREPELDGLECDMAWLTVGTPNAPASYRVSDALRARGIPTVLGGIHPSTLPGEAAAHATAVCVGEGEETVGEILADFDGGAGLRTRYDGHRGPLDALPVPAWRPPAAGGTALAAPDLCPWIVPVQTSRGCRNACSFCSTTRYQGATRRHRPVAEVVAEIRALQDQGVLTPDKTVFFTDNNIVSDTDHRRGVRDTRHARELFEALLPLGINWVGQGEVQVAEDEGLVDLMARSGCTLLLIGLESVSDEGLRGLGKPDARAAGHGEALEVLHRHGVANIGCFILGLDTDGPGSIAATERFIRDHVDVPQVSLLTPFPGTPLFRRMEAEGRLLHRDWSKYDITHVVFRPARMSPDELEAAYAGLVRRVYSPAAIGARVLRNVLRRTVNGMPRFRLAGRVTSILAPNLVYRRLSLLGRGGGAIPAIREAPEACQGSPAAARGHAARPAWAHAGGVGA